MSDFARGVIGVLAVGMVVGVGALMLIPQSSPSAMRFAEPPAKPCSAQVWPASERVCEKWMAPRRGGAGMHKPDGTAAAEPPMPAGADAPPVAQSEPAAAREPARATASRSAQNRARGASAARPRACGRCAVSATIWAMLVHPPMHPTAHDGRRRSDRRPARAVQARGLRRETEFSPCFANLTARRRRPNHPSLAKRAAAGATSPVADAISPLPPLQRRYKRA